MVSILLVEDSAAKAGAVRDALADIDAIEVVVKTNAADAAAFLKQSNVDILVLDLLLPRRRGEAAVSEGGAGLLEQLERRADVGKPRYIIGLTAHERLHESTAEKFRERGWLLLHFDQGSAEWQHVLRRQVYHASEAAHGEERFGIDIAVLTALEGVELGAVLDLECNWREVRVEGEPTVFHAGNIVSDRGPRSIVAASAHQMGMAAAACLAMKTILRYRPRIIAMCGIAAGTRADVNMGDILVADQTYDYGSGKSLYREGDGSVFLPAPTPLPLDAELRGLAGAFMRRQATLDAIAAEWRGPRPPYQLRAHFGPVGSGAAVVQDQPKIDSIKRHNRKLLGIEMEAYAVFLAAATAAEPRPRAISIKSVADRADAEKSDDFQAYAAFTSARFMYEFARQSL